MLRDRIPNRVIGTMPPVVHTKHKIALSLEELFEQIRKGHEDLKALEAKLDEHEQGLEQNQYQEDALASDVKRGGAAYAEYEEYAHVKAAERAAWEDLKAKEQKLHKATEEHKESMDKHGTVKAHLTKWDSKIAGRLDAREEKVQELRQTRKRGQALEELVLKMKEEYKS